MGRLECAPGFGGLRLCGCHLRVVLLRGGASLRDPNDVLVQSPDGSRARVTVGDGRKRSQYSRSIEDRGESIVIGVFDRIVWVGVALSASKRDSLPHLPGRVHSVSPATTRNSSSSDPPSALVWVFRWERCGGELVQGRIVQEISGELAHCELVEGHIGIQCANQPIAVWPNSPTIIAFVALRIGIAREVEPQCSPSFSDRGKPEPVRSSLERVRTSVLPRKARTSAALGGSPDAGQEMRAEAMGGARLVEMAPVAIELSQDKSVEWLPAPFRIRDDGNRLGSRFHVCPMFLPFGALLNPVTQ